MTEAVTMIGSIAAIVGISVATDSIMSTRKLYDEDYMRRKRRAENKRLHLS